jgi:DNA polymerase (family 10)
MQYITITDHSPAAHYARGVTLDRLKAQWDEIDAAQEQTKIRILRGTECDILEDGALDYPANVLEKFDIVIASLHSRLTMSEAQMTRRVIQAMKQPLFKVWGHALARLVGRRAPVALEVETVLDAVAQSRAAIEVNGDPYRLDLEPKWIRAARDRGIPFVVSNDAHSTAAIKYLPFGVAMARRGGLRRREVLNTLDVHGFTSAVRPTGSGRR